MGDGDYQAQNFVANMVKTENLQLSEPNKEKAVVNDEDNPEYRKIGTNECVWDILEVVFQKFSPLECL